MPTCLTRLRIIKTVLSAKQVLNQDVFDEWSSKQNYTWINLFIHSLKCLKCTMHCARGTHRIESCLRGETDDEHANNSKTNCEMQQTKWNQWMQWLICHLKILTKQMFLLWGDPWRPADLPFLWLLTQLSLGIVSGEGQSSWSAPVFMALPSVRWAGNLDSATD